MMSDSSRCLLGFEQAVLENFSYLESEFGLKRTGQSPYLIRFETNQVYIDVFHAELDYEVGIYFGLSTEQKTFSFLMYLRRFFPDRANELGETIAGTPDAVAQVTSRLARAFRATGGKIIEADPTVYTEMGEVRWWHFRPDALR